MNRLPKVSMKKLNKVWKKATGASSVSGIKLDTKVREIISNYGYSVPFDKIGRFELAAQIARNSSMRQNVSAQVVKSAPTHTKTTIKSGSRKTKSNAFYASWDWKQARYEALQLHGRQCMCCGWSPEPGSKGHLCVDHIKPRSKFPALALDVSNLQVLCNSCNMGKSNVHQDDFRAEWHGEEDEADPLTAQFNATMQ